MRLKTIVVVICALVLFPCVLTDAKVIKLSVEEMLQIRGNLDGCPGLQVCREKCKSTGSPCYPPHSTGVPCDAGHIGEECFACAEEAPKNEICGSICTINPFQSCTPDSDVPCSDERVGTCQDLPGGIQCAIVGSVGPCAGGPVTQCH